MVAGPESIQKLEMILIWDKDDKLVGGGDWFDLTGFIMESTKVETSE